MNKKLLSLAVAAGLASSSASAVDLNAGTGSNNYASELTIGTGVVLAQTALNTVTVNAGFSISDSTERYMRFDITGATFTDNTALALAVDDSGGVGTALEVLSTGGGATQNFVIYEVTASAGQTVGVTNDANLTLPNLSVTAQGPVGVTYQLFSDPVDAVNNTSTAALVTSSGNVAVFTAANTTSVVASPVRTAAQIDVTNNATQWVDDAQATLNTVINTLGSFQTVDNATVTPVDLAGAAVTSPTVQSAAVVTVTGDFTYAQDLTSGAPDGTYTLSNVYLDTTANDCAVKDINATTVTDTEATFALPAAADSYTVCVIANGVSVIDEIGYTAVYAPTENAGFTDADTALTLFTLEKNGSSTNLNLALKPGGAFSNFIRVNNTSNITGDVFFTLYNDAGDSVTVALGDIEDQTTSALAGQASTSLITIQSLADAGTAADSTWAVADSPRNKLRVVVNGEFSSIAAQSITLSTDNTTFTTF